MKKIGIILPTYAEEENIGKMITDIFVNLPQATIVVVDDSPNNKTFEAAEREFAKIVALGFDQDRGIIEKRSGKNGRASAVFCGMRKLYDEGADFVIEMDTDLSHPPSQLKELAQLVEMGGVDMVICSRDVKGAVIEGWPLKRHLLHFAANSLCRFLLRIGIRDYMNAYRMYSRKAMAIALNKGGKISSGFWAFGEVIINLKNEGCVIKEIPTRFVNRTKGESMVSLKVIIGCFVELMQVFILLQKMKNRRP